MPRFKYTAVNQQNKKLSGIIDANTEHDARRELNTLGFSILNLEEMSENEQKEPGKHLEKLKFEAIDRNGKKVVGSIRSPDTFLAYSRLRNEYNFSVNAIYPENASGEQIKKAREIEIGNLEKEYLENKNAQKGGKKIDEKEYVNQRKELLLAVDEIIKEVRKMSDDLQNDITPDYKVLIKKEINKLLRLKTSSNLDYIKQISEGLIKIFEDSEIFKDKESNLETKIKIKIQSKILQKKLNHIEHPSLRASLLKQIAKWQKKNIIDKENPNAFANFFNRFLEFIYKTLYESEEILKMKRKVSQKRMKFIEYIKIWLTGNKTRKELIASIIKQLWIEIRNSKKNLRTEIKNEKKETRGYDLTQPNVLTKILKECNLFIGWLLAFYLMYYFLAIYILTKDFGIETRFNWYLFDSAPFKYLFTLLFLTHAALSIKFKFFPKNVIAAIIIMPLTVVTALFMIYNV